MTTEQKERLVQAAFEIAISTEQRDNPISTAIERSHVVKWVKQGAQTVLDNYHDYGLQSMEKYKDMVSSNVRLGAENRRLREALDRLLPLAEDGYKLHKSNGCHQEFLQEDRDNLGLAKEALKQQ